MFCLFSDKSVLSFTSFVGFMCPVFTPVDFEVSDSKCVFNEFSVTCIKTAHVNIISFALLWLSSVFMLSVTAFTDRCWHTKLKMKVSMNLVTSFRPQTVGSFSIDDGDGSENVTFKKNARFFKLCRVYSNPLKMSNVGEFFRSWFLGDRPQV